jgi:hypothetical protein
MAAIVRMMYSVAVKLPCNLENASQTARLYHKTSVFEASASTECVRSFGTIPSNLTCRFEKAQHQWQVFSDENWSLAADIRCRMDDLRRMS